MSSEKNGDGMCPSSVQLTASWIKSSALFCACRRK